MFRAFAQHQTSRRALHPTPSHATKLIRRKPQIQKKLMPAKPRLDLPPDAWAGALGIPDVVPGHAELKRRGLRFGCACLNH